MFEQEKLNLEVLENEVKKYGSFLLQVVYIHPSISQRMNRGTLISLRMHLLATYIVGMRLYADSSFLTEQTKTLTYLGK